MPHISVHYSDALSNTFDRKGFARELHIAAPDVLGTTTSGFKTRFTRIGESVFGDEQQDVAWVQITAKILSGRAQETRAEFSELVLELARKHLAEVPGVRAHISVDVRDMDRDSYRAHRD